MGEIISPLRTPWLGLQPYHADHAPLFEKAHDIRLYMEKPRGQGVVEVAEVFVPDRAVHRRAEDIGSLGRLKPQTQFPAVGNNNRPRVQRARKRDLFV